MPIGFIKNGLPTIAIHKQDCICCICKAKINEPRKKHSTETRIKISNSKKMKKNWNYKHGLSRTKSYHKARAHKRRLLLSDLQAVTVQMVYEDNIKKYGTLTCYLCLKPIEFGRDSLDHNIPLSKGGSNLYSNLGVAHLGCNSRKKDKTYEEYKISYIKKQS